MIAALARRLTALRRADPYAPRPEPLATTAELTDRIRAARAEVADMRAAAEMNGFAINYREVR